jgi:hypothetical protein
MKRKRFSVEQIVAVLKQAELGMPVAHSQSERSRRTRWQISVPPPLSTNNPLIYKLEWTACKSVYAGSIPTPAFLLHAIAKCASIVIGEGAGTQPRAPMDL